MDVLCNSAVSRRAVAQDAWREPREADGRERGVIQGCNLEAWRGGAGAALGVLRSRGWGCWAALRRVGYSIRKGLRGYSGVSSDLSAIAQRSGSCRRAVAQGGEGLAMRVAPAPPSSWGLGV